MEYRRSEDGGRSWSQPIPLEYSRQVHESGRQRAIKCEKAVRADTGDVILFNLEHANKEEYNWTWKPQTVPTYLRSADGGQTWDAPRPMGDEPGRIWDAIVHDGNIYVLQIFNDGKNKKWYGNLPKHHYSLYVSTDSGRTFSRRSILPLDIHGRGYGTMSILPGGRLIAYVYNINDEHHLDYVISDDAGHTWSEAGRARFARRIRNPQMAAFRGGYVLHGRSGNEGEEKDRGHFVLYTSRDGIHWDDGRYLKTREAGHGAYSNNLLVHDPAGGEPRRLLIQASHAYERDKTNIYHWWLT